jgi:hypothetical protein
VQPLHVVSATSGPPDAWLSWNGLAAKEADRLPQKPVQVFVASCWRWYERVIQSHARPVLRMRRSLSVLVDIDARIARNSLDEREGATVKRDRRAETRIKQFDQRSGSDEGSIGCVMALTSR